MRSLPHPQSLAAVGPQPCPLRPQDNAHPSPGPRQPRDLAAVPPETRAQGSREVTSAAQPHHPTLCWGLTSTPEGAEAGRGDGTCRPGGNLRSLPQDGL